MTAFSAWYKKHIFKANAEERLIEIDFLINNVIADMTRTPDPTQWNRLLNQKELLEIERQGIAESVGRIMASR